MRRASVNLIITISALLILSCQRKGEMEIYLLIGQSNMAGRAEIRAQDKDSLDMVYLFTGDSIRPWEQAANPLNIHSTIRKKISMQKLGPGYSFGKAMSAHYPGRKIGLVVNARGGTSIREWLPGTEYYHEAVQRARASMEYGSLKGVLWYQGTSDTKRTESYLQELTSMINALRTDLDLETLPFIACELSVDKPLRKEFNQMLSQLPGEIKNTAVIKAADLVTTDSTHFDSESQIIIGERFAEAMIGLLK